MLKHSCNIFLINLRALIKMKYCGMTSSFLQIVIIIVMFHVHFYKHHFRASVIHRPKYTDLYVVLKDQGHMKDQIVLLPKFFCLDAKIYLKYNFYKLTLNVLHNNNSLLRGAYLKRHFTMLKI